MGGNARNFSNTKKFSKMAAVDRRVIYADPARWQLTEKRCLDPADAKARILQRLAENGKLHE